MPLPTRQIRRVWGDARGSRASGRATCTTGGQVLLGHAQMSSTTRYVNVQDKRARNVQSPLDRLLETTS